MNVGGDKNCHFIILCGWRSYSLSKSNVSLSRI